MQCVKCNTNNRSPARFCKQCGAAITNFESLAKKQQFIVPPETKGKIVSLDEALKDLNMLVGLKRVKDTVTQMINYLHVVLEKRKLTGETEKPFKHFVFLGNPGTGKKTVARILGDVFKTIGMLPTNNFIETDKSNLVAEYYDDRSKLVNEQCDKAMGGILFIDRFYELTQGLPDNGFRADAVNMLLKRMEDDRGKFVVIAAGCPKEMKAENNHYIPSYKFTDYICFDDYNPDEMREIFIGMCKKKDIEFAPGFDEALQKKLKKLYDERTARFGNAHTVRQIFNKTMENVSVRVLSMNNPEEEQKREILIMRPEDLNMTVLENAIQCLSCKETIDDDSRYCDQCGKQIMMVMVCSVCGRPGKGKYCVFDAKEMVPAAAAVSAAQ